jgi:hypothetical protein
MAGMAGTKNSVGPSQYWETAYAGLTLSYGLSHEGHEGQVTIVEKVANAREDQGNKWWSQRDSNPCLSLERADDDEVDQ